MLDFLNTLFQSLAPLWEMSLTAAYAAAVLIVLRLLLKKRAPKQVLCLLWLVVFARLLIPVSLESPLSIVPSALPGQEQQISIPGTPGAGNPANPSTPQSPVQENNQPTGSGATPVISNPNNSALTLPENVTPSRPNPPEQAGFSWQAVVAGVWLAGAAAMGLYALASYFRLRRRLFDAIRARDGAWEHPAVESPFILGMLRPRIYLPAGLVGQPRKFILCHERAHLRRLDHIVKPVCWIALALHWFNPLVWAAFILMSRDIESACDEAVVRQLGSAVKADYSTTLLALATGRRVPSPCPLAFDEGDAKGRIKNVLGYRRPALWVIVVSALAAVLAAVCLLTDPVAADAPEGNPAPDTSASQPPETTAPVPAVQLDTWMKEVLDGELGFVTVGGYDHSGRAYTINDLVPFFYGEYLFGPVTVDKVAILDMDRDGINELIVWPSTGDVVGYLILRRQGDEVFGYAPRGIRSCNELKADGTFWWSSSAARNGTASMTFENNQIVDHYITWCDNEGITEPEDFKFFVDGRKATQAEFEAACAAQSAKPEPTWYAYENGVLSPVLPDGLELIGQSNAASDLGDAKLWLENGEIPWLEWNGSTTRLGGLITPEQFSHVLCRDFDGDGQNEVVVGWMLNGFRQLDLYEWKDGRPVLMDSYDTQQLLVRFNQYNVAAYNKNDRGLGVTYVHVEGIDDGISDYYRNYVIGHTTLPEGFFDGYENIRDGYPHAYAYQYHLLYPNERDDGSTEFYMDFEFCLADETMTELDFVDVPQGEGEPPSQYAGHYMAHQPVGIAHFNLRYDGTKWNIHEGDKLTMDYQGNQATSGILGSLDHTLITSIHDISDDPGHWSLVAELPDDMIWLFTRSNGSQTMMKWDGNFYQIFDHTAYTPRGIMPVMKKIGPNDNVHYGPIAVISTVGSGTGVSLQELVVYDLDAIPAAVDYTHDWRPLRDDFNSNVSYHYDKDTHALVYTYQGQTLDFGIDGGDEVYRRIEEEGINLRVTGNVVTYWFDQENDGDIKIEFPVQAFIGNDVVSTPALWPQFLTWTIRFNGHGFDTVPGSCEIITSPA